MRGSKHKRKRRRKNDNDSSSESDEHPKHELSTDEDSDIDIKDNSDSESDIDLDTELMKIDLDDFEEPVTNDQEYQQLCKKYSYEINEIELKIKSLSPNMKSIAQYLEIADRWKTGFNESKEMRNEVRITRERVDDIIGERAKIFMTAFDIIRKNIKPIYKSLTISRGYKMGGQAFLDIDDGMEPFNSEVSYHVMPPGKPFREMELLSGGEKSVASLALLFAIHSFKPSPFFILDEIDAALDSVNVQRVSNYIKERAGQNMLQTIVISLKDAFFSKAQALIGVCKDRKSDSSTVMMIDLTPFERDYGGERKENVEDDDQQDGRGGKEEL